MTIFGLNMITNSKINFLPKGHNTYVSIENPLHGQSEKACICFKTRRVRTCDFTDYELNKIKPFIWFNHKEDLLYLVAFLIKMPVTYCTLEFLIWTRLAGIIKKSKSLLWIMLKCEVVVNEVQKIVFLKTPCHVAKVQILWEGHKIWKKKISHLFLKKLGNVKKKWEIFFQIFVAFSEYLNFTLLNIQRQGKPTEI